MVRVICIPKFCKTGEIVLVNLSTLETELVRISAGTLSTEAPNAIDDGDDGDDIMNDIEEL